MLDFVENDILLFRLLEDIGNRIEGYNYTKFHETDEYDTWDLEKDSLNRKERLNKDINILVQHILETYKS